MTKKPYPAIKLTNGLDVSLDALFIADQASPYMENVWFDGGIVKKGVGFANFGANTLAGTVMHIDQFPTYAGDIHYVFSSVDKTYKYNANGVFGEITANDWTGDEDDRFSGVPVLDGGGNSIYAITNGKDFMKYWDGANTLANLGGVNGWNAANVRPAQLAYHRSRLIGGKTTESGTLCPTRVRWSVLGNVANIAGTGSGFVELVETSDWITKLFVLKNKLFVMKERSIWELEYTGNAANVYRPIISVDGVGSYAPDSVVNLGDEIIFYGSDNVYRFDGLNLKSIGDQIYPWLYDTNDRIVSGVYQNRAVGTYIEELGQYLLCLPSSNGSIPSILFTYDFDTNSWTKRNKEVTAFGYYGADPANSWSSLTANWANWSGNWLDRALPPGAPTTLIGCANGNIFEDTRLTHSNEYMCYDTKDWTFEHAERWTEYRVLAKGNSGGNFRVYHSTDSGGNWTSGREFAIANDWTEYVHWINITSRSLRIRVESTANELEIKWIEPWYIVRKRSKSLTSS